MDMRHCDEVADDPAAEGCVRDFINHVRSPAHGALLDTPRPTLFATHKGKRVQVVFASRHGDVGITSDMRQGAKYRSRVMLEELTEFSGER